MKKRQKVGAKGQFFSQIKNFLKPTIPEASHRGISPVSFWPRGQKPKFYILPHPELRKGNSDLPEGGGKFGNPEAEPSGNYLD